MHDRTKSPSDHILQFCDISWAMSWGASLLKARPTFPRLLLTVMRGSNIGKKCYTQMVVSLRMSFECASSVIRRKP